MCCRWHLHGECVKGCFNAASHVPLDDSQIAEVKIWIDKCRAWTPRSMVDARPKPKLGTSHSVYLCSSFVASLSHSTVPPVTHYCTHTDIRSSPVRLFDHSRRGTPHQHHHARSLPLPPLGRPRLDRSCHRRLGPLKRSSPPRPCRSHLRPPLRCVDRISRASAASTSLDRLTRPARPQPPPRRDFVPGGRSRHRLDAIARRAVPLPTLPFPSPPAVSCSFNRYNVVTR
jgi:hypothetical protein